MKINEAINYIANSPMFNWSRTHGHRSTFEMALRCSLAALQKQAVLDDILKTFWMYHKPTDRISADDVYMILESIKVEED